MMEEIEKKIEAEETPVVEEVAKAASPKKGGVTESKTREKEESVNEESGEEEVEGKYWQVEEGRSRTKKTVERVNIASEEKPIVFVEGKGTKIGDMESVVENVSIRRIHTYHFSV